MRWFSSSYILASITMVFRPPVGDMAGDTNCFSGLRIADEIHGHGYSDHRRTYGGTGNAGYGVRQGYQDTAMEAAGVVIVFGGVCFQAYRHAAAVDFINVDMEIISHEMVLAVNIPYMLPDLFRVCNLDNFVCHNGPILLMIYPIYLTRQGRGLQDGRAASSPESQLYDIR